MKISSAIIISLLTVALGLVFSRPILWLPLSIFFASIIEIFTRRWVASDDLGSMVNTSVILKFIFSSIGFYAVAGQLVCVGIIIWWFIF